MKKGGFHLLLFFDYFVNLTFRGTCNSPIFCRFLKNLCDFCFYIGYIVPPHQFLLSCFFCLSCLDIHGFELDFNHKIFLVHNIKFYLPKKSESLFIKSSDFPKPFSDSGFLKFFSSSIFSS